MRVVINQCLQFKGYLRLVIAQENLIYPEILQLMYEGNLIKLFPKLDNNPPSLQDITKMK